MVNNGIIIYNGIYRLWTFDIAIEQFWFMVDLPIQMVIFHSHVSLQEGNWDNDIMI